MSARSYRASPTDSSTTIRPWATRITVNIGELATATGRAESTVRLWMRDHGLPYSRIGGCVMIHLGQFEQWFLSHQEGGAGGDEVEIDQIVDDSLDRGPGR